MQTKIYAGIGSHKTPLAILEVMQNLGNVFARHNWLLRSGFSDWVNQVNPEQVELFLPWPDYEQDSLVAGNVVHTPSRIAYDIAAEYHPAWKKCNATARAMHARNVQIVLGVELTESVELVICWTPQGKLTGGTAMAMRVARAWGIEVRNLAVIDRTGENGWGKYDSSNQIEFCW